MRLNSRPAEPPAVITTARQSSDDEFDRRLRKYAVMMTVRGLAVIGAAAFYHVSIWISLVFVAAGAVLPWCAVLIANDGPAKKRTKVLAPVRTPVDRSLPAPDAGRTVDGEATNIRTETGEQS
ncbi:MAG TPA: DUF3099 domain-containing protein [Jatrophihabitans sp.]